MIVSRGLLNLRRLSSIGASSVKNLNAQQIRNSGHWRYRQAAAPAPRTFQLGGEILGAIMWWWILWNLFTEPEHIYGEHPWIDIRTFTDAELGIPPDNEETNKDNEEDGENEHKSICT